MKPQHTYRFEKKLNHQVEFKIKVITNINKENAKIIYQYFFAANFPCGEFSVRRIFLAANFPTASLPAASLPAANFPAANFPGTGKIMSRYKVFNFLLFWGLLGIQI